MSRRTRRRKRLTQKSSSQKLSWKHILDSGNYVDIARQYCQQPTLRLNEAIVQDARVARITALEDAVHRLQSQLEELSTRIGLAQTGLAILEARVNSMESH